MSRFLQWLSMGGYALYVWSAYGIVFAVLVLNTLGIRWQKKQTRLQLQRWFKRDKPQHMPLEP